jgi:hypothetical protein
MSLKEERMQILRMLEEGKIKVEEAANLLSALETGANKQQENEKPRHLGQKARWLRIRVTNGATGKHKVNINLPIGVANAAMKIGAKFAPELEGVNINELVEAIESESPGKIIEVQDSEDGEHVEIFVE